MTNISTSRMIARIKWIILIHIFYVLGYEGIKVCDVSSFDEATYDGPVITAPPGMKLVLKCKDRYEVGFPTTTCVDGTWTEPTPPCKLVYCPFPGYPRHGILNMPCRNYNCTSTYGCVEGYWYTGKSTTIRCQRDNTWNDTVGTCEVVKCPPLSDPHGSFHPMNWSYNALSTLQCDQGFTLGNTSIKSYRCLANRNWDSRIAQCKEITCPELPQPENGHTLQSDRSYLAVATIVCDEGYNYSKPQYTTRQCQGNNTWTGEEGTCERIHCPNIGGGHNGIVTSDSGRYNDTIILQCHSGHTLNGPGSITCLSSGTWSSELGVCTPGWTYIVKFVTIAIISVGVLVGLTVGVACFLSKRRCMLAFISQSAQRPDEEEQVELLETLTTINLRFNLKEDFSDEYPDEASQKYVSFMSAMEEGIRSSMKKTLDILAETVKVISLSKAKRSFFITLSSSESFSLEHLIAAIEKTSISTDTAGIKRTYTVAKGSVYIADNVTNALKQKILMDRHKSDRSDDKEIDFENNYVDLRLVASHNASHVQRDSLERRGRRYQKQDNNGSEDITDEQILEDGDYGKLILVRGRAGVGKSTLMQRKAWHWANGDWGVHFKAIFLLSMRGFLGITKEMDLYFFLSCYSLYGEDTLTHQWFEDNSQYICIMLDGLDEVGRLSSYLVDMKNTTLKDTPMHWCFRLLTRNVLSTATIIVCSRPLPELNMITPSKVVEVLGLHRKGVFDFIRKNVPKDTQAKVKQSITDNPILHSACAITYYCQALCTALVEDDKALPGAEAAIRNLRTYTQITAYIMEKSIKRSSILEYSEAYDEILSSIARLADLANIGIQSAMSEGAPKLVFTKTDLNSANLNEVDVRRMAKAGLLVQYTVRDSEDTAECQVATEFAHLSMQEFWAMVGLLNKEPVVIKACGKWMASSGDFNMALLFLSGLGFNENNNVIGKISNIVGKHSASKRKSLLKMLPEITAEVQDDLLVLQMVHESQSSEVAKVIGDQRFQEQVSINRQSLTLIDMKALTFLFTHHPTTHSLSMKNANLDITLVDEIAKFLKKNYTLKHIRITDRYVDDDWMEVFMSGVEQNKGLQTLELSCGRITQAGVGHFADAIIVNSTLKEAWLKNLSLKDEGAEAILAALDENPTVSIWVASLNCSKDNAERLGKYDRFTATIKREG